MVQVQTQPGVSPQDYLALERVAAEKSEYFNGQIYAMAGASPRHTLITANTIACLHAVLKDRPCAVHTGDLRVKVSPVGLYTYPDVVVVCGRPYFDDEQQDTLLNPTLLVEVLSKSTEAYDRTRKFEHYRWLESFTDYVLISQERALVEHWARRPDNRWLGSFYMGLENIVPIESLGVELATADIYDKIEWPDPDSARGWLSAIKEPGEVYAVD